MKRESRLALALKWCNHPRCVILANSKLLGALSRKGLIEALVLAATLSLVKIIKISLTIA